MVNINVNSLTNVLATAIQQAATQVSISTPSTTAMTIIVQPSPSTMTAVPLGNRELYSSSSTA